MYPAPSPPSPISDNPAPSSKTPRPRLRGLSYLRGHTQSSSASSTLSNASSAPAPTPAPDRSRPSRFGRSVSSPAQPESQLDTTQHIINNTILPSVRGSDQAEQNTYLARLESALRPLPLSSTCEGAFRAMARNRSGSTPNGTNGVRKPSDSVLSSLTGHPQDQMPTIRLTPHQDPRSTRPSLAFPATSRTLPHEDCVIRVGRYSERDTNPNPPPNTPSSAPVGFKSKVVSRRHCEFWCSHGQWYIKDMKSSSGTFLNHIRLSQPSVESKPFPVHDGDVVQLGIDFRGGEEMIFRCVKIRVECNRAWQKTLNNYNVQTHKRLRDLGKTVPKKDSDTASTHSSQECSICLMSIAPCQSLFVAPCSHVWHYKCIRPILNDHKHWPQFLCPNCRAVTDLEADVDDPEIDGWEDENGAESSPDVSVGALNGSIPDQDDMGMDGDDEGLSHSTSRILSMRDTHLTPQLTTSSDPTNGSSSSSGLLVRRGARRTSPPFAPMGEPLATRTSSGQVQYLRPITPTQPLLGNDELNESSLRTPMKTDNFLHDGPMTPTNNAGPFVFDGSAGRAAGVTAGESMSETDNALSDA